MASLFVPFVVHLTKPTIASTRRCNMATPKITTDQTPISRTLEQLRSKARRHRDSKSKESIEVYPDELSLLLTQGEGQINAICNSEQADGTFKTQCSVMVDGVKYFFVTYTDERNEEWHSSKECQ